MTAPVESAALTPEWLLCLYAGGYSDYSEKDGGSHLEKRKMAGLGTYCSHHKRRAEWMRYKRDVKTVNIDFYTRGIGRWTMFILFLLLPREIHVLCPASHQHPKVKITNMTCRRAPLSIPHPVFSRSGSLITTWNGACQYFPITYLGLGSAETCTSLGEVKLGSCRYPVLGQRLKGL